MDILSRNGEYIGPEEDADPFLFSSTSSSSSSSEEKDPGPFELESSEDENPQETEQLVERISMLRETYPQDVWTSKDWMADGLLIFIKFIVLTFYYPVQQYTDMNFIASDSDSELVNKMLYHRWITAIQTQWVPKLYECIEIRLHQFLRDMQRAIGPNQQDHPMYHIFALIQKVHLIKVKRKIKRGIDNQQFIYEASTGAKYNIDHLKECNVVCDPKTGRPIIEIVNGKEMLKTEPNPDAIVGTDPRRPKSLIFVPQKSEDRKSTRLNSSHIQKSRMPSSA